MDRIKIFSGSITKNTSEIINRPYGVSSTENISRERTDILNNALVDFLNECGAEVNYDGKFLWIHRIPITFSFYQNYNYYGCYFPFDTKAVVMSTTATDIFHSNGLDYNFKVRLLGEPTRAFFLIISRNYQTPVFSTVFAFFKATNIINGRESRLYNFGGNISTLCAIDLDDAGLPVNIDRNQHKNVVYNLNTDSADYSNNAGKYPLVEWNPAIFKVEGCYFGLPNSPLPAGTAMTSDGQTFLKLGDDTYYRPYTGPLIKCIS